MATEKVQVTLSAEGQKQVVNALKQVQKQAVQTGKKGAAGISSMNAALGNLKSILPALGIASVVAGFGALIKHSLDFAESLDKAAQRTGLTAETLSTLAFAAELSGTTFETFEKGVTKLARTMSDAQNGLVTARRPFDQLGISVENADGSLRSTEEVFGDVADRFSQMEDGSKKTALALEIFGRSGAELIPTLNQGREGIAAMQDQARGLGLEISTNTAQQAAHFKDNISRLSNAFVGIGNILLAKILPTFNRLTDRLVEFVQEGEVVQVVAEGIGATFRVLGAVITGLVAGLTNLGTLFKIVFQSVWAAATGDFAGAKEIITKGLFDMKDVSVQAFSDISDAFTDTATTAKREAPKIADAVDEIFTPEQIEKVDQFEQQIKKLRFQINNYGKDAAEVAKQSALAADATDAQAEEIKKLLIELEALREKTKAAAEAEKELTDAQKKAADEAAKAVERRAKELAERIERETVTLAEIGATAQEVLTAGFERMILSGEGFRQTLTDLIRALAQLFIRMLAFRIFGAFFDRVLGGASSAGSTTAASVGGGDPFHFAGGGMVRGAGGPTTDSILARVSTGEFIVRAASVAQPGVLPMLTAINSTAAPATGLSFAQGGIVPELAGGGGNINIFVDAPGSAPGSELRIEQAVRKAVTLALLASADENRRS